MGFEGLFLKFHEISFSNDFWLLDRSKDFLIMMFPENFFLDATLWIVGSTIIEAVLLTGVPVALLWWRPWIGRRSDERLSPTSAALEL